MVIPDSKLILYNDKPTIYLRKEIWECLKQWAHEVHDMCRVVGEALFMQLPAVETEDK